MTALYQRQATGAGQLIDVSMLESMLSLTLTEMQAAQFPGAFIPGRAGFGPIATGDGYINLSVASERTFQKLAAAAGGSTGSPIRALPNIPSGGPIGAFSSTNSKPGRPSGPPPMCKRRLTDMACPARPIARQGGDGRPAARASPLPYGSARQWRHLPRSQPALPLLRRRAGAQPFVAALGEHTAAVLGALGYSASEIAALTGP